MATVNKVVSYIQFEFNQVVFYKLNPEIRGLVVGILIRSNAAIEYEVAWADTSRGMYMYDELTVDKPII